MRKPTVKIRQIIRTETGKTSRTFEVANTYDTRRVFISKQKELHGDSLVALILLDKGHEEEPPKPRYLYRDERLTDADSRRVTAPDFDLNANYEPVTNKTVGL